MKRLSLTLVLAIANLFIFVHAQAPDASLRSVATPFETDDWLQLQSDVSVSPQSFFTSYGKDMGLTNRDAMKLTTSDADEYGLTHHAFQQYHNDVLVEFAVYKLHARDGAVVKTNGTLARNISVNTEPVLTEQQALDRALACIGADVYNWEVPRLEEMKKEATGDAAATFYPVGELLIADADFNPKNGNSYKLTWKFDIHSASPSRRDWVYVDAITGEVVKELDLLMHEHAHEHAHSVEETDGFPGIAETRYSGTVEIITDSTAEGYVLQDFTRGRGIETYDALNVFGTDSSANFVDDDNYWANANERANDAATDCHWASEQLYDYLRDVHSFDSYDNKGSKMISYVHYGESWRNASWNGFWGQYGDADGEPWVYMDVVGHEYAHGFTWATAALLYTRESGALNESFSDILGEVLQAYINGGDVDWLATPSPFDTIRDYANPSNFNDPDTYLGDNWQTDAFDNFGVHTNSGVQNRWFYLLSTGGEGVNDNGEQYSVQAIGMDAAMQIVMRNMTTYLFPTSQFADARQASLFSAEDIFGLCSDEYKEIANAWHAVGVGDRVENDDYTVTSIEQYPLCELEGKQPLTINLRHMGCDSSSPIVIEARVLKSNPSLSYTEMIEIPEGVGPGESFSYTFTEEFDFSRTGEHTLQVSINSDTDLNAGNDETEQVSVYNLTPIWEHDFRFYVNIGLRTFRDSMSFYDSEFADARVLQFAGRDSTPGILIEGDRARYASPVLDGEDVFETNHRQGTRVCMCINATDLDSLGLQFDLRQTYSNEFGNSVQLPQPQTSALRVMAGDDELARYFPQTNFEDEWQTHNLDLEAYLGLDFTLCFESRTILGSETFLDTVYDRVFLDNIIVKGVEVSTSVNSVVDAKPLELFPNPTKGQFTINLDSDISGTATLRVLDLNGQELDRDQVDVSVGNNLISRNMADLGGGMYMVELITEGKRYAGKLIVL